ncbi:MAG: hypothetical protein Q9164_004961 [Protoblastenia rupestris]
MSAAPLNPNATPLPVRSFEGPSSKPDDQGDGNNDSQPTQSNPQIQSEPGDFNDCIRPQPKPSYPIAKLRFECRDLTHPGAKTYFSNTQPASILSSAVTTVLKTLYTPSKTNAHIPPTRSVTLILRSLGGVAYTTGSELDNDHKEMHFSLDYIHGITSRTPGREAPEIEGVVVHEMVHAWQWNGLGTAPGGLIEGIADFVRLKAGLSPPHWKREVAEKWDQGYQHTAYFLEWMEEECGEGSVRRINDGLRDQKYDEDRFWQKFFGKDVGSLWEGYKSYLEGQRRKERVEGHAMGEDAFWNWVKREKGGEETIVLKAMWRTRKHVQKDRDSARDAIDTDLEQLWAHYIASLKVEDAEN